MSQSKASPSEVDASANDKCESLGRGGESPRQPAPPTPVSGVLSAGDSVRIAANDEPVRFILLAGKPLNKPVVQHGPFVMNTREQIERAICDYKNGILIAA